MYTYYGQIDTETPINYDKTVEFFLREADPERLKVMSEGKKTFKSPKPILCSGPKRKRKKPYERRIYQKRQEARQEAYA